MKTQRNNATDPNAKRVMDMYTLRDKLVAQINFLKDAKSSKKKLKLGGHIAAWEGFLAKVDQILLQRAPLQSIDGWQLNEKFYVGGDKSMIYRAVGFPTHTTIKGEAITYSDEKPLSIEMHESLCFKYTEEPKKDKKKKKKKDKPKKKKDEKSKSKETKGNSKAKFNFSSPKVSKKKKKDKSKKKVRS